MELLSKSGRKLVVKILITWYLIRLQLTLNDWRHYSWGLCNQSGSLDNIWIDLHLETFDMVRNENMTNAKRNIWNIMWRWLWTFLKTLWKDRRTSTWLKYSNLEYSLNIFNLISGISDYVLCLQFLRKFINWYVSEYTHKGGIFCATRHDMMESGYRRNRRGWSSVGGKIVTG